MSTGNQIPTFNSFTITQPFLGAPLQFQPALGSKELEDLIDAYVVGNACKQEKLSSVTIDFYNHATVDINTGSLVRRYDVIPWSFEQSPSQSQSSGLSPPIFTPSPASSATCTDSTHGSMSTPPNRTRGSRVTKKTKKEIKKPAEIRLPGFSIMTKDGIDITNSAGRGTKTKEQREHAHLMRIIKACDDCKRKKIRCDPSHRRSSHTNLSRNSASSKPSPHSQSNPSPAASTPSLSRETTQGSEKSSPPVDSFTMDDFVLFPEDDLNQWNPEMSIPGFDTQYSNFSMTNYDTFPDFDTSFSTMNDNLSFNFPSFDQSSLNTQPFTNSSHISNYYNTDSMADVDVNSQYISPTQPESDMDFFDSFGDLRNLSPTHTLQAHNATGSQAFSTTFGCSPTDSYHQPPAPDFGLVNTGLDGAYDQATISLVDSGSEVSQSQTPQSESSDSGLEIVTSSQKGRSPSQRNKRQSLLESEFRRIEGQGRDVVNAFLSGNGELHVPGASAGLLVSSPAVFHGVDRLPMNANASRSFVSGSSPVHEETPWSFESTLSSLAKSRPEVVEDTVESDQGKGLVDVEKLHESLVALARPSPSTIIDASLSRDVRLAGGNISSRLASFAPGISLDQQVSSARCGLVPPHVAVASSRSGPRSRSVVDTAPQVISGVLATGVLIIPDRFREISSPGFIFMNKLDSKVSSRFSDKVANGSLNYIAVESIVSNAQDTSAAPLSGPRPSLETSTEALAMIRGSTETVTAPATTAPSKTTIRTISKLAALALGLAATVTLSRQLEASATILLLGLLASLCHTSGAAVSRTSKSCMNKFVSASIGTFGSSVRLKMDCEYQRACRGKDSRSLSVDTAGDMLMKFFQRLSI